MTLVGRLSNQSTLPTPVVRRIMVHVRSRGEEKVWVLVRDRTRRDRIRGMFDGKQVSVFLARPMGFPRVLRSRRPEKGYLEIEVRDRVELAVVTMAHEYRHARQTRGRTVVRWMKWRGAGLHLKHEAGGTVVSRKPFPGSVPAGS